MDIDEWVWIIGTQKDINSSENSSLAIGDKLLIRTDYQVAQHKSARRDLQEQLDSQSRRVIQLRNPNQGITNDNESVQQDLINIDTENLQIGSERMKLTYAMLIIATS